MTQWNLSFITLSKIKILDLPVRSLRAVGYFWRSFTSPYIDWGEWIMRGKVLSMAQLWPVSRDEGTNCLHGASWLGWKGRLASPTLGPVDMDKVIPGRRDISPSRITREIKFHTFLCKTQFIKTVHMTSPTNPLCAASILKPWKQKLNNEKIKSKRKMKK